MAKIMILEVSGGRGDYRVESFKRIVSVQDEVDFLAGMRINVLKEIMAMHTAATPCALSELEQASLIHSIKTRLTDTGLVEYPQSTEEEVALYRRFSEEVLV